MLSHYLSQLSNYVYFTWIDAKLLLIFLLCLLSRIFRLRFPIAACIFLPPNEPFHAYNEVRQIFSLRNHASIFNDLRNLLALSQNFFTCAPIEHKLNLIAWLLYDLLMISIHNGIYSQAKKQASSQLLQLCEPTELHLLISSPDHLFLFSFLPCGWFNFWHRLFFTFLLLILLWKR